MIMRLLPLFRPIRLSWLFLILLTGLTQQRIHAQCSPGSLTISSSNTVINTYYPVTGSVNAGYSSILLSAGQGSSTPVSKGDLLLLIQMQGSSINSENNFNYGDGVASAPASGYLSSVAGTYEYVIAANDVALTGGTLYLTKPIVNTYINSDATASEGAYRYQIIRVPRYSSLTITGSGSITASLWDGTSGGVVALEVTGDLTLAGTTFIDVSTKGFRGGGGRQLTGGSGSNTDIRTSAAVNINGSKGEGIAGTPQYMRVNSTLVNTGVEGYPGGSYGNGAPGNAGGGATDGNPAANEQNSGGGGGGNGGRGGRGGRSWNSNLDIGGYGGVAPSFLSASRLILGGGGGAGSTNNATGADGALSSSGGIGGGIVILKTGSIIGSGTIIADGQDGYSVLNDGGGGGGAGGTVYISSTNTAGLANVTVFTRGGKGGDAWPDEGDIGGPNDGNPEHGPGGGGGGGAIYTNGTLNAASSVDPGLNGNTTSGNHSFGAEPGLIGIMDQNAAAIPAISNATCDIDVDDDGIPNIAENSAGEDPFGDADNDGTPNAFDTTPGGTLPPFVDENGDGISDVFDTDRDGIINSDDLDSDNDGIPDIIEAGGTDTDNNGIADDLTDSDGDGLADLYDPSTGGSDISNTDNDRDGIPNARDLDADNDGILDVLEAGLPDTDGDGIADGTTGPDGWSDLVDGLSALNLPDTDGRGPANYLDIDADDDGLTDNVEAQSTAGYVLPSGNDADSDGIDDVYDNDDAAFAGSSGNGLTPYNHDGTDTPDYMDNDSDNDGDNDLREGTGEGSATLTNITDTDNDGLVDQFDTFNNNTEPSNLWRNVTIAGFGNGGTSSGPTPAGSNVIANQTDPTASNRDWRNDGAVLPVHFMNITLNAAGSNYTVKWTVSQESNVREYVVERSIDGINFTAVGSVPFASSNGNEQIYSYTDGSLPVTFTGTVYYRVREVDNDNRSMYSSIVSLRVRDEAGKLRILGNPVTGNEIVANLVTPASGRVILKLVNANGTVVIKQTQHVAAGNNTIRLNSGKVYLANGIYFLEATIDGSVYREKIQVSR